MSYITIKDLPEILATELSGNEYMMTTDADTNVSNKFTVDSMVTYVGNNFDNTVDSKLELKVDKITGKGLSTEDFSTLEKEKLNSLENYIHPSSGIVPGDYTRVIVNSLGHVTGGSNPDTITGYGITDAVNVSSLGVPNGIATLDATGLVTNSQVPIDILEFGNIGSFPITGVQNKIYISLDNNKVYRWNNSNYIRIGSSVDSVAGRTGSIILSKSDVGLNLVDNTADVNKNVLSSTKLITPRLINGVSFDGTSNITIEANDPNKVQSNPAIIGGAGTKITYDSKGLVTSSSSLVDTDIPNLDASKITSGIINADRLPSYVDDVVEFADLLSFPETGETGKIYIALDTNKAYRWSGSVYIYITSGAVDSVAGKTGVVLLDKSDVSLSNVDNTADIDKPISSSTQTALNGKADSATTLVGYNISDAYTKTEVDNIAATKQDTLISATNIKTINDTSILGSGNLEITVGSGGYAANVYLTALVSSTNPSYSQISYTPDVLQTSITAITNNNEVLLSDYIFDGDVKATSIPAGEWAFHYHRSVSNTAGSTVIRFEIFKRSSGGVETVLFSVSSNSIEDTVPTLDTILVTQPVYSVADTDRIGIKLYTSTTRTSNTTVSVIVGDGNASYFTTPLEIRHNQLRARDAIDAHPIGAISNLQLELDNRVIKNTNITAGTYKSVTVDVKGLVTAGTNPTTLSGFGITDAYTKTEVQTDLPKVGLNTTNLIAPGVGQIAWNIDENTIDVGLNGATLQVGQEQLIRVRNNTASIIQNGSAVMATGTIGNSGRITIAPANLTQSNAKYILGIVTEDISVGADGFVTTFGKIRNINTTGTPYGETWVDGDVLYVKDSGNGALTKVVPTDTQVKLPTAIVIHAHTSGVIFVRVNSIDENHAKAEIATKANINSPTLVTPNIGVATGTSFNSITGLSDTNPLSSGTATVGTSTLVSREDHIHPSQTNITGNAGTATKLQTAITINGVSFDGSANITIPSQSYITSSEYLTELVRNSKQVYGIEVDIGAMPNTTVKDVPFTFNGAYTYWIDNQNSYCDNATASYPLNYPGMIGESISCFLDKTNNKIKVQTSDDKSSFNGKVILLYTK